MIMLLYLGDYGCWLSCELYGGVIASAPIPLAFRRRALEECKLENFRTIDNNIPDVKQNVVRTFAQPRLVFAYNERMF